MRTKKQGKQQGFILALALLMMLFVGLVVITSTERTGQETRISQSDAPIATLQAAAEAGLLTLREKIHSAGQAGGGCHSEAEQGVQQFCGCVEDISLADLMDGNGYLGHEMEFSSKEGLPDVYWWFEKDQHEKNFITCFEVEHSTDPRCDDEGLTSVDSKVCRIAANVFVGDPKLNPGHFMAGKIDIRESESVGDKVDDLFGLGGGKNLEDLTAGDLDGFYEDDFLNNLDASIFSGVKMASGDTLSVDNLVSGKINIVILEGGINIPTTVTSSDNLIIIVSNSSEEVCFINSSGVCTKSPGGGGSGGGNQTGLKGWIVAPEAEVNAGNGRHLSINVVAKTCRTGNFTDACFDSKGGSSFDDGFLSDGFNTPELSGATSGVAVDSSEKMNMDFDY